MTYHVTITRCNSYDPDAVRSAVARSLDPLGGMGKFVGKGQRVLVKPNLLASRAPEAAVTTHPAVVQAVVEEVQRAGGVAVIGDSPGGRNMGQSYAKAPQKDWHDGGRGGHRVRMGLIRRFCR